MLTSLFWKDAGERAAKTFAQALLALIGAAATTSVLAFNWPLLLGTAATAAVISVLTSLASAPEGGTVGPASLVSKDKP